MSLPLHVTLAAWRDLEEIVAWISENDSDAKADYVLDQIVQTAESIAAMPHRGTRPKELPPGLQAEFRQVFFKPYRVIYEITPALIVVHLIADRRRDLRSLLMRRLFPG